MDFLKEILGDDLYGQLEARLNEHNGKEENQEKQIKLGNLGSGEYVSKAKHDSELEKLNLLLSGMKITQHSALRTQNYSYMR